MLVCQGLIFAFTITKFFETNPFRSYLHRVPIAVKLKIMVFDWKSNLFIDIWQENSLSGHLNLEAFFTQIALDNLTQMFNFSGNQHMLWTNKELIVFIEDLKDS